MARQTSSIAVQHYWFGVCASDDDNGFACPRAARLVIGAGQLELFEDVVTKMESFGDRFQAAGLLGEAGNVEATSDRTRGSYEPIPRQLLAGLLLIAKAQGSCVKSTAST